MKRVWRNESSAGGTGQKNERIKEEEPADGWEQDLEVRQAERGLFLSWAARCVGLFSASSIPKLWIKPTLLISLYEHLSYNGGKKAVFFLHALTCSVLSLHTACRLKCVCSWLWGSNSPPVPVLWEKSVKPPKKKHVFLNPANLHLVSHCVRFLSFKYLHVSAAKRQEGKAQ